MSGEGSNEWEAEVEAEFDRLLDAPDEELVAAIAPVLRAENVTTELPCICSKHQRHEDCGTDGYPCPCGRRAGNVTCGDCSIERAKAQNEQGKTPEEAREARCPKHRAVHEPSRDAVLLIQKGLLDMQNYAVRLRGGWVENGTPEDESQWQQARDAFGLADALLRKWLEAHDA